MLLTITTTHTPATDLGYLLHKHPDRVQAFALPFGAAHVFYPEATEARCTAALLVEVDPIGLVRGRGAGGSGTLDAYVNDRPYAASSFLSVAIGSVYRSVLIGATETHAAVAETLMPFTATIAALPCAGGEAMVHRLFAPLGYAVTVAGHALDPAFPAWGQSRLFTVTLDGTVRLRDLLSHLYVLIPVLDGDKHYFVGTNEVEKLMRRGEGWLATHPERGVIASRYLHRRRSLTADALAQLTADEGATDPRPRQTRRTMPTPLRPPRPLRQQRWMQSQTWQRTWQTTRRVCTRSGSRRCLRCCAKRVYAGYSTSVVARDGYCANCSPTGNSRQSSGWTPPRAPARAAERLHLDRLPPAERARVTLLHGALTYRDDRLAGYDAAALVEVVEHLDPPRLAAFERVVWQYARPGTVIAHYAEPRVQRPLPDAARRAVPPPRPPLRVDARRVAPRGPKASPPATATPCASPPSAPKTRNWARPRRWLFLRERQGDRMSAIDQYDYTALGVIECPTTYNLFNWREPSVGLHVAIYRLDMDIPPDERGFRGKRGDILLGGGDGEAFALHIHMPESLRAWTDSDIYPPTDHNRFDFAKAFWEPNEAFILCEGYLKLGWTPDTIIEHWLMEHTFAFLVREYPDDYARYVGSNSIGEGQDGSICRRLTPEEDRVWNWKRYR